jgi:hypothetical protein
MEHLSVAIKTTVTVSVKPGQVHLCPPRRAVATRKRASAVAKQDRATSRARVEPTSATKVDRHARAIDHDRKNLCRTSDPPRRRR